MTYEEAVSYIESIRTFGTKPGLRRVRALCAALGNPQDRLRAIHVTGTNGKGSTASFCRAILQAAGYKTGLFMSPYVDDFRERIQFDGDLIPKEDLIEAVERADVYVRELKNLGYMQPGQFELETAIAFDYFARKNCDFAVIEVGIGGKSDCTNILKTTDVAVFTSISLDHTASLGPTVRDIAHDKSGIIKPGCAAVCIAGQHPDALDEIRHAAQENAAPLTVCDLDGVQVVRRDLDGTDFTYRGLTLCLRMPGVHQIKNAVCAVEAMLALRARGVRIPDEAIEVGIASVKAPGRLEAVGAAPLCLLDGGHNPGAIAALMALLDDNLRGRRLITIMGMFADKDYVSCVQAIASRSTVFIASSSGQPRSQEAETLASLARRDCAQVHVRARIEEAVALALELAKPDDVVLVSGSIYNIAPARSGILAYHKM
jgi:dihydrofolate synthase/folylpolyglutamate synthase